MGGIRAQDLAVASPAPYAVAEWYGAGLAMETIPLVNPGQMTGRLRYCFKCGLGRFKWNAA